MTGKKMRYNVIAFDEELKMTRIKACSNLPPYDEARENLREVIEGNILLALQVGLEIPRLEGVAIEESM